MRKLTSSEDSKKLNTLHKFLLSQEIDNEIRPNGEGESLWVIDDRKMFQAKKILNDFESNPQDVKYINIKIPSKKEKAYKEKQSINTNHRTIQISSGSSNNITLLFIFLSVFFTYSNELGMSWLKMKLYFSQYQNMGMIEIENGEVWRLITPIFLHGGLMHLGFNMLWLYQLGGEIEHIKGSRYLFFFTMVLALLCNLSQYYVSGPSFIGMSGIVYGLLGYIWMMSKFEIGGQFYLPEQTVGFMVIWLVICLVGIIPNVANTQHVVGFLAGTLWGFITSGGFKSWRRRQKYKSSL